MMKTDKKHKPLLVTTLVMAMAVAGGCSSGGGSSSGEDDSGPRTGDVNNPGQSGDGDSTPPAATFTGQAVDGYIVGGQVYCDGVESGLTQAGGGYHCPDGTNVVKITGGVDVGFDETKTTSDVPFAGQLLGAADSEFITPVSTLAIALAGGEDNYDPSKLDAAVATIKKALGLGSLDLKEDPAASIVVARLNAQVNLIAGIFSTTQDDYSKVMGSFAKLLKQRSESDEVMDINGTDPSNLASTIQGLHHILEQDHSDIAGTDPAVLNLQIAKILNAVRDIEASDNPEDIAVKPTLDPELDYALGLSKYDGLVTFTGYDDVPFSYSVQDYENSEKDAQGKYTAVLDRGIKRIDLNASAITVGHTISDASIDVALSVQSTDEGDHRKLSAIARGLKISMTEGDASSVQVEIPTDTIWHVEGVKADGTTTVVELQKGDTRVFSASRQGIDINFDDIGGWLVDRGYPDMTHENGNFVVTCVISGLDFARLSGTTNIPTGLRVDVGDDDFLAGQGLEGFVTVQGFKKNIGDDYMTDY